MSKLISSALLLVLAVVFLSGCSGSKSTTNALTQSGMVNQLSKELGMTKDQTEAGLGAIMMLSKDKLSPDDFSKLSKGIPGGTSSLISEATKLGVVPGSVSSTADIIQVLTKLGVSPVQAAKFTGSVLKFAGSLGGSTLGLLSKVL
ncbi:MAG TPA: DUF2780 domain-containing protein [Ignavibacteria bacterium]|nr:DUF2780 domain-containing protein [Ignavibacteria bacterium]HMR39242.1 DUF2780 domain-containing protein [Ignavibacteria bacterium]